jgi:predicted naringenin-chalcone synthase
VLKELLGRSEAGERVLALAFGPGLTIETAVFTIAGMA